MATIIFSVNYPEMERTVREVFKTHVFEPMHPMEPEEFTLETIYASSTKTLLEHDLTADVLVARGANAYDLRRRGYHIPVVELIVSGSDLITAIDSSRKAYGITPTAVIGSFNMLVGIENLAKVLELPIYPFYLRENSLKEIIKNIDEAQESGFTNLIGGVNGCKYAKTLGFTTTLIKSGNDSIWQALSEAKHIAQVSRMQRRRSSMYKTILDHSYEGIIATDTDNRLIVSNNAANKMLGVSAVDPDSREQMQEVLRQDPFSSILDSADELSEKMIRTEAMSLLMNKADILLDDARVGTVLTFQDMTKIQELEGIVRDKIRSRGHRAKYTFADIIGRSKSIEHVRNSAAKYADLDSNILIIGETGTGKELFAQSIHNASNRANEPFVAVNCAALPESLLESELFGYVEGAFTGAVKGGKKGLFELAHNGTIFLDEISEMPLKLQGRLLRVLQEQEVMRVGHDRVLPVNVRTISASNSNLLIQIREGRFREDLFFRLNVFTINVPAIRDRPGDIELLVDHFIRLFCRKHSKERLGVHPNALRVLNSYPWPGNIRELRNVCERLVVLSTTPVITQKDVVEHLSSPLPGTKLEETAVEKSASLLDATCRESILSALEQCHFSKSKAAELLGISRATLWRRMKSFGLS